GSELTRVRPTPKPMLTRMTPNESSPNRRDQNQAGGSCSTSLLSRGTAQRRNGGYMTYAQINATIVPSTPPNPSSRSGFACTINKLPNPNDAPTIDQNDAGNVMRSAAVASFGASFPNRPFRSASVCQLNFM